MVAYIARIHRMHTSHAFRGAFTGAFRGAFRGAFTGAFTGAFRGTFRVAFKETFRGGFRGAFMGAFRGNPGEPQIIIPVRIASPEIRRLKGEPRKDLGGTRGQPNFMLAPRKTPTPA